MKTNILNMNDIEQIVYRLCFEANTCLDKSVYDKILNSYITAKTPAAKNIMRNILQNAGIAYNTKTALCQDTGQVLVFVEIGENVQFTNGNLNEAINNGVKKCYKDNYFRKSVVKNAVFDRINTFDNAPAIIHTDFVKGEQSKITVMIKGAGSENKSKLNMMLPTSSKEDIKNYIAGEILKLGENSCPPMFVGIGAGGTMEKAAILSKKALFAQEFSAEEQTFADEIKKAVNEKAPKNYENCYVLGVNLLSTSTHIASLPIAMTVNCHSLRESSCIIHNGNITYLHKTPEFKEPEQAENSFKEVFTDDVNTIKSLKQGEEVLLTGEIFVARDEAHKRLFEMLKNDEKLPFDPKNKIIFYAGPCPAKPGEVIGAIGPTTSGRMDKYAISLYELGLLGTIGKGERSKEVKKTLEATGGVYFTVQGGIAALLKNCVKKSETIAFSELGTEAVLKIEIKQLPAKVSLT